MEFLVKRLIAILLNMDKDRIRGLLITILERAYAAADRTASPMDDMLIAVALAVIKDDRAWQEIVDSVSHMTSR